MKIARLGPRNHEIPMEIDGDRTLDLRPITSDVFGEFLAAVPALPGARALRVDDAAARGFRLRLADSPSIYHEL